MAAFTCFTKQASMWQQRVLHLTFHTDRPLSRTIARCSTLRYPFLTVLISYLCPRTS